MGEANTRKNGKGRKENEHLLNDHHEADPESGTFLNATFGATLGEGYVLLSPLWQMRTWRL